MDLLVREMMDRDLRPKFHPATPEGYRSPLMLIVYEK